jgi:predicted ATP-grasp superfamily ATP-dependent carboligase
LTQKSPSESEDSILNRLSRVWPLSEKWIVQEKLQSGESAEFQWGGVRTLNGKTHRRVATERWKQPAEGGTACWVELGIHPEIEAIGDQIAETLDLIGMAEMAFMYDATQHLRLIEANTRAWLQIALFDLSGMELVYSTYRTLLNLPSTTPHQSELPNADWVNPERMLLTALSGAYGNPLSAIIRALTIIRKANHISVYQTTFPKVRSRWLGHLLRTTSRC